MTSWSDFQGSSRVPKDGLRHKNLGDHGLGARNWHLSYTAAPAGEAWAALGSPSLQPWVAIATGRPRHWRHKLCDTLSYTAVQASWQHALFDWQQDNTEQPRCGVELKL